MKIRKILGFALGPFASAAFGLIIVPFIAWAFSADDVGRFNVLQITLSFCLLLITLGLDQAYVREFHESHDRPQLLKACFTPGFLLLVVAAGLTLTFSTKISQLLYGIENPVLSWITIACVIAAYLSRFLSLILRMQERGLAFSMSQIIPKALLLVIIGSILLFDLPREFLSLLIAFFFSSILVVSIYIWNTRNQWRPALTTKPEKKQVKSLLNFGTPLIFSGLAYWGLVATSTITLRVFSNFTELGIYSITTSIAGIAAIFQSIFSVIWAPIVYKWVAEEVDLSRIDSVARHVLTAVCALFLGVGIFSWMIDYLLPAQYSAVKYLVLCAIVQPLLYTLSEITCVGIAITRRTMLNIWVTMGALSVNVILSLWLVPLHGAAGAVMANAVAYLVFFVARTEASAFVWRQFRRTRLYVFSSMAVAFSVATVALGPTLPFHYAFVWLALVPVVGYCFRAELSELLAATRNAWTQRFAM